jgi:hypothetical protein
MAYDRDSITELLDSLDSTESYDSYDSYDSSEARRGGQARPGPLPKPQGGGYSQPRPTGQFVTQTQLQAALARVAKDVSTNAEATKTVNTRVAQVATRQDKDGTAIKKDVVGLRGDVKNARDMSLFTLLLQPAPTAALTKNPDGTVTDVKLNQNTSMLPLMLILMMGMGDSSKGEGKSGSDDMMLPLMLIMMMQQQQPKP